MSVGCWEVRTQVRTGVRLEVRNLPQIIDACHCVKGGLSNFYSCPRTTHTQLVGKFTLSDNLSDGFMCHRAWYVRSLSLAPKSRLPRTDATIS